MPLKNKRPDYWFYLEPTVHLLVNTTGSVLFYQSLTKKILEFHDEPVIHAIALQFSKPRAGYVIPLFRSDLEKKEVKFLIDALKKNFMGDILETRLSTSKPINIRPEVRVKHDLGKRKPKDPYTGKTYDIARYLHELAIHLNAGSHETLSHFESAFKQFLFPQLIPDIYRELPFEMIEKTILEAQEYKLTGLNITGINIFQYTRFDELNHFLHRFPFRKKFHTFLQFLDQEMALWLIKRRTNYLSIDVTFPSRINSLSDFLVNATSRYLKTKFEVNFIIQNPEELAIAQEIIRIFSLPNVYFKPFFNGSNFDFFQEYVFIRKADILESKPDQKEIFSRLTINEKDFGKLNIFANGEVFANCNDVKLGNISSKSICELVIREIEKGTSWKRNRSDVTPCKTCQYRFLCPPISAYEILLNRYHFCTVYQDPDQS